jgi:hypothetical protein
LRGRLAECGVDAGVRREVGALIRSDSARREKWTSRVCRHVGRGRRYGREGKREFSALLPAVLEWDSAVGRCLLGLVDGDSDSQPWDRARDTVENPPRVLGWGDPATGL